MNENDRKELARLERREAAKRLKHADRLLDPYVKRVVLVRVREAQERALQWSR